MGRRGSGEGKQRYRTVGDGGRKRKEIYAWRNRGKRACGIQMEEERSKNVRGEKKRRKKEGGGKR